MYRRMTFDEIRNLRREYLNDDVFNIMALPMSAFSKRHSDIDVVEVWKRALSVIDELKTQKRPERYVGWFMDDLRTTFATIDNDTRTEKEVERSVMLISLAVFYMLSAAGIGQNNPNQAVCDEIARCIPDKEEMSELLEAIGNQEDEEERKGHAVANDDYLKKSANDSLEMVNNIKRALVRQLAEEAAKKEDDARVLEHLLNRIDKDGLFGDCLEEMNAKVAAERHKVNQIREYVVNKHVDTELNVAEGGVGIQNGIKQEKK